MTALAKTLFLEMPNILFSIDLDKLYQQLASYCKLDLASVKKELNHHAKQIEAYQKGEMDTRSLFHELPPHLRGGESFRPWMEAISTVLIPFDGLTEIIKALKKNKIRLYTLSNICEAHFAYAYTHFPLLHLFDGHINSYEVKAMLPEKQIYEQSLALTNTCREQAFYITASTSYAEKARLLSLDCQVYQTPEALSLQLQQKNYLI